MLPFFRKIRYRLAKDNQFFKYFRYAVGEIILVVIGILIALYINNWNERRKEREKFDLILVEVENELINNIENARGALRLYQQKDSVVNLILENKLTVQDYKNHPSLYYTLEGLEGITVIGESFKKLAEVGTRFPEQDSILDDLKVIHNDAKWVVSTYENQRNDFWSEVLKSYKKYPWYNDWIAYRSGTIEMDDFFINSPIYKADVAQYSSIALGSHRRNLELFELLCRESYLRIYNYLESKSIVQHDTIYFTYNADDFSHYTGKYLEESNESMLSRPSDSTIIEIDRGRLYLTPYYRDGTNSRREIIPVSKYSFRTENSSGFWRLNLNDSDDVIGMSFSAGRSGIKFAKVR